MKLAEALCVRADLQKKIAQLEVRLQTIAKVQEGDSPDELPDDLLSELSQAVCQLEMMAYRINVTNIHTFRDGESITRMIARKDVLTLHINTLRNVLKCAAEKENRYGRNEIKYVKTMNVNRLRKKIDALSAELRKTDLKIQETNWMVELLESDGGSLLTKKEAEKTCN